MIIHLLIFLSLSPVVPSRNEIETTLRDAPPLIVIAGAETDSDICDRANAVGYDAELCKGDN